MIYEVWITKVPEEITDDRIWKVESYRLGLYASDLAWVDHSKILRLKHYSLADQLYRSVSSISANIIEGYSRKSQKEKARYYEIALGSAYESKDWYFKSRFILGPDLSYSRIRILVSIIKLLHTMIKDQRKQSG